MSKYRVDMEIEGHHLSEFAATCRRCTKSKCGGKVSLKHRMGFSLLTNDPAYWPSSIFILSDGSLDCECYRQSCRKTPSELAIKRERAMRKKMKDNGQLSLW